MFSTSEGGRPQSFTQAAPNQPTLGKGAKVVGAGHRLGGGVGDVRQASCTKLTSYARRFLTACEHRHTRVSIMCWGSLQKPSFKKDTRFLLLFPSLPITSDFLVPVIACRIKFDVMTLHCLLPSCSRYLRVAIVLYRWC